MKINTTGLLCRLDLLLTELANVELRLLKTHVAYSKNFL